MKVTSTPIHDVVMLEPKVFEDVRGSFFESANERALTKALGVDVRFVQDNQSSSIRNVVRGLHYQIRQPQGKLVRVLSGEIFDVAVDLRRRSPSFGRWVGAVMTAESRQQIWIPAGFAHGFAVLFERADVLYKTTDYYAPEHERTILWNDPMLAVGWPVAGEALLSLRDRHGVPFDKAEVFD
jgi:dTDP-4-dehydrorhamnose 3,5-epimerase